MRISRKKKSFPPFSSDERKKEKENEGEKVNGNKDVLPDRFTASKNVYVHQITFARVFKRYMICVWYFPLYKSGSRNISNVMTILFRKFCTTVFYSYFLFLVSSLHIAFTVFYPSSPLHFYRVCYRIFYRINGWQTWKKQKAKWIFRFCILFLTIIPRDN